MLLDPLVLSMADVGYVGFGVGRVGLSRYLSGAAAYLELRPNPTQRYRSQHRSTSQGLILLAVATYFRVRFELRRRRLFCYLKVEQLTLTPISPRNLIQTADVEMDSLPATTADSQDPPRKDTTHAAFFYGESICSHYILRD